MITAKIDVTKINNDLLFKGAKGTYMDIALIDKPSEYRDGFIVQDVGKERREAGEKGPIIGNWKHIGQKPSLGIVSPEYGKKETAPTHAAADDGDDIPF